MLRPALISACALASCLACLASLAGCDVLFGPPPTVIGGERPSREGEDEEGNEGEGEGGGEGEVEVDVPPDIRPNPQGPNIQSFDISTTRLRDVDTATITVVVTDVDGAEDIVGPLLIEPVSGSTLGALTSSGPGTFTANVAWSTFAAIDPIEFNSGTDQRFIRVQFSDIAGHQVTQTQPLTMFCDNNAPACSGSCGQVRCPGQDNACLDTGGASVSGDDLCGVCNVGCESCASGCACFDESPRCSGSDCLVTVDGEGQGRGQCAENGGIRLRDDGFVVWDVAGVDHVVLLNIRFSLPSNESNEAFFASLCAPFGGINFYSERAAPSDLRSSKTVLTVEEGCTGSNLAGCEPVLGVSSQTNPAFTGNVVTCNEPLTANQGTFGNPCFNGSCSDGSTCDADVCVVFCSGNVDCSTCAGDGCTCNTITGLCEAGAAPVGGDFGEPCLSGSTCNGGNLFCDTSFDTCAESCSFASDCVSCNATTGTSCTCDSLNGVCVAGGGGGGTDFSCVTSASRQINTTGTFSGTTSGGSSSRNGSCGQSPSGPEQLWKFTPPSTGTYTFATLANGFDTVLYALEDCSGAELVCDDDGASSASDSRFIAPLTAGVPVVIVVDGYTTDALGSYSLVVSSN